MSPSCHKSADVDEMTPSDSTMKHRSSREAMEQQPHSPRTERVGFRKRLKHFTFAWFLSTMSTGGLAIAIAEIPHKFNGLYTIGVIVFFLNIVLFVFLSGCMIARAILYPQHFLKSFTNPMESLFIGSFWLSISVIIGGIQVYGISHGPGFPWLIDAVYVLYWVYAACSLVNSIAQYWILIQASIIRPIPFTPSLFLAGYSAMLTGTIASLVAGSQSSDRAVLVIVSGLAFQGYGWLISLACIVYFIRNLLDNGLPPPQLRPGLFIPVGSVAYTIVVLISLARAIPDAPKSGYFANHPSAKETLEVMALFFSIFMWLFSFWMFLLAVVGNICVLKSMPFSLTWWAFIFPNVGFTLATSMIGMQLESDTITWCATIMTILLVIVWLASGVGCIRAVLLGRIMWPGKDEDKSV